MNNADEKWTYDGDASIQAQVRDKATGLIVCNIAIGDDAMEDDRRARLIAAAPSLLRACRLALYNKHPSTREKARVFEVLAAAILEAEQKVVTE